MKYLIVISHLLFTLFVLGQKSDIIIEVSETDIAVGQNITISITTSLSGNIEFKFPSNFQKGYAQMEGMSQEYSNGLSKTIYYKTQNGFFTEKGKYVIGPAVVKSKGKLYKSNRVKINVRKSNKTIPKSNDFNRKLKTIKTLHGEINVSEEEIYEGESFHLNAKVYSKYAFSKYGYTPYEITGKYDNFELENTSPLALAEEQIGGERFYTLTLDNRLVFPLKSGTYVVNPFEFDIVDNRIYRVNADKKVVTVQKLPTKNRPDSFIGLVGDYDFNVTLSNNEADLNEVITLQISINGMGNFHNTITPSLNLPEELELYADPVETKDYEITESGFGGALNFTYPLKVVKKRQTKLPEIALSYFSPKENKYITYTSAPFSINENSDSTDVELGSNQQQQQSIKKEEPNRNNKVITSDDYYWIPYLFISMIGLGALLLFWLYLKRRGSKNNVQDIQPSIKDIKAELNKIEQLSDSNTILSKMEECLSQTCSLLIGTSVLKVSRNEIYVLLIDKLESDELYRLKELYRQLDVFRFSKETSNLTLNDIKIEFKDLVLLILSKKT